MIRKVLLFVTYITIFTLAWISAPDNKSILPTEIKCLKNKDSEYRKCAYCWNKPDNLHPSNPFELHFPATNSGFVSTKSCKKFTC